MARKLWLSTSLFVLATLAWAQSPTLVLAPFSTPSGGDSADLARTLFDNWSHQWSSAGFVIVDGSTEHPARFQGAGVLVVEGDDLVLQVTVVDRANNGTVASDVITLYRGLTAFDPLNKMLQSVTNRGKAYWESVRQNPLAVPPLVDALTFESVDEGAEVFWQGHQSIGVIEKGRVKAPYYPFPSNAVLTLTIEKAGYRTRVVDVALNAAQISYRLPALEKLRIAELVWFDQYGRLLGLGLEARTYWVPDWAFWSAEVYPFVQYRPGLPSRPVLHLDTAVSAGTWLLFSADSWFRFGLQSSVGVSQTVTWLAEKPGWYVDVTMSPFIAVLEWKLGPVLLENRLQIPYSFGVSSGLLPAGWLIPGGLPMVSVGGVIQW